MGGELIVDNQIDVNENDLSLATINRLTGLLSDGNNFEAFKLIFLNNSKGCLINIAGGFLFGFGTVINLAVNGFFLSDIFVSSYYNGVSIASILKVTLPHSIELVGFWLSGAIGFYIVWIMIKSIKDNSFPPLKSYLKLVYLIITTELIILVAAFIEAYISVNMI
jgi:uncharacterized membrane protein SpoIIM required for sporulation